MLDIQIFSMEKPIYEDGKQVGFIPHISLGTYTQPTPLDQKLINNFYEELAPAHRAIFNILIHALGQLFFASSLVYQIEKTTHPIARQRLFNLLKQVHPKTIQSRNQLLNEQDQLLNNLHKTFRPTHMVAMMMQMKFMHDASIKQGKISPMQDEIFARGIAKCVQSIQDIPEKEKAPQIKRFCKRSTHRWKNYDYSSRS